MKNQIFAFEDTKYIKWQGRYYIDEINQNVVLSYSNSGLTISFYGSKLSCLIFNEHIRNEKNLTYIAKRVDNSQYEKLPHLEQGENHIVLFEGEEGDHTVSLIKLNEALSNIIIVKSLTTDGKFIEKENEDKLKIEFYGDSLTCAYQVEGKEYDEEFDTKYENSLKSYAYLACEELNAECSLVCLSGFPIYQSKFTDDSNIKNIPDMFDASYFSLKMKLEEKKIWDKNKFMPDFVVINLGSNDQSILEEVENKEEFLNKFHNKYVKFINDVKEFYENKPKIIMFTNMAVVNSLIVNEIEEITKEFKDITLYKSNSMSVGGVMPGLGHPNEEMQKYASHELAILIKKLKEEIYE